MVHLRIVAPDSCSAAVQRLLDKDPTVLNVVVLPGVSGKPAGDLDAVIDAVMAIAEFATANRNSLHELDVNPLLVLPDGQGAIIADALVVLAHRLEHHTSRYEAPLESPSP